MRILALSDIHNSLGKLQSLEEKAPDTALAVICGDLTSLGPRENVAKIMKILSPRRVVAVPGNMDSNEVLARMEEAGISIHGACKSAGEKKFCGFGGGSLGKAGLFNFSGKEIKKGLSKIVSKESIMVTHLPPLGSRLDLAQGSAHIGSGAVREILEEKKPFLHLCGHVHEAFGEEKISHTLSVNVGAVKDGRATAIELDGKTKIERIEV